MSDDREMFIPASQMTSGSFIIRQSDPLEKALETVRELRAMHVREWEDAEKLRKERDSELGNLIDALRAEIRRQTPQLTNAAAGQPQ